jgi:hypothetical protein
LVAGFRFQVAGCRINNRSPLEAVALAALNIGASLPVSLFSQAGSFLKPTNKTAPPKKHDFSAFEIRHSLFDIRYFLFILRAEGAPAPE